MGGEAWRAAVHGVTELDTAERLDCIELGAVIGLQDHEGRKDGSRTTVHSHMECPPVSLAWGGGCSAKLHRPLLMRVSTVGIEWSPFSVLLSQYVQNEAWECFILINSCPEPLKKDPRRGQGVGKLC